MNAPETITITGFPTKSEIVFKVDRENWVIKITKEGIIFNRECFPDSTPDDFAKCFMDIVEKEFKVKFEYSGSDEVA